MAYTNRTLIERTLAQALTTGSPRNVGTPVDLVQIGNTLDSNLIPNSIVDQYIQFADREIDASLSALYVTPFCELADFETSLLANIDDYNSYVTTMISCPFNVGDIIVLTDGTNEERHVILASIDDVDNNIFQTEDDIQFAFLASNTRVLRISYPLPVAQISTNIASAKIYDKYFASQSDTSSSKYGDYLRDLARNQLNEIIQGIIVLHGVHKIGDRFRNSNLRSRYNIPIHGTGDANANIEAPKG